MLEQFLARTSATIKPMQNDLATRFASMPDAEVLHLGSQYAKLTDEAQGLVRAEFSRRHLEVPEAEPDQDLLPGPEEGITTLRRFRDQGEALLARSVLESAGVGCFLLNENTIRNDWLWSNLLGGIRLQVAASDVEAAEALLSQPIPAQITVAGEAEYYQPQCPKCGSLDIGLDNLDAKIGATSILLFGFPLPNPVRDDSWHCANCGTDWIDDQEAIKGKDA